ncbi:hypothetical protein [Roseococcus microcysteis]|uniref:hypothetical protein n=1 Tax=Roseococcus microcysteis TaxID=2771361 RepID=UPI00168BABE4|nr:hypothetical protein [Roseococcus microcysteis]
MWGELAWRLRDARSGTLTSGAEAFALLAESDARGVSPGQDVLKRLIAAAAPCLILVDEWVAFARQMYFRSDLPAGDFGANMSFAQALTEVVSGTPGALLVASLPQSDIEIGGTGGPPRGQPLDSGDPHRGLRDRPSAPFRADYRTGRHCRARCHGEGVPGHVFQERRGLSKRMR